MRMIDTEKAWKTAQRIYSDPVLLHAIKNVLDSTPTVEAVVLPCKIGDEFWTEWVGIRSVKCSMLTQKADGSWQGRFTVAAMGGAGITVSLGEIEKRLFRTRAEAEAALAKMKGGADNA